MIELNLKVSDPTRSDAPKLLALAALFTQLAQGSTAEQARAQLEEKTTARVVGASPALAAPYTGQVVGAGALDPADNPERGLPSPAEAFGTSMGNGAAGSGSASSLSHASTGAASQATTATDAGSENGGQPAPAASLPDPAVAFGGNPGNAAAVPPPPNGPQASNGGTPQTLPPPSPGATIASPPAATPAPTPGTVSAPAATTNNAPAVDLDSEGLPWDVRIHASSKAKIANGSWKLKRGQGEVYVNEVKAQLRQALAAGNGAAPAGVPATPPATVPPPPAVAGAPVPPPASSAGSVTPTAQASPPTTQGAAGSSTVTLAQVMPRVTAAIGAGTLTVDSAAAIVRELSEGKIDNVAMLAVAPALLPAFVARLDALGIPA